MVSEGTQVHRSLSEPDRGGQAQVSPSPGAQPALGPSERKEPGAPETREATPGGPVGGAQPQPEQPSTRNGKEDSHG